MEVMMESFFVEKSKEFMQKVAPSMLVALLPVLKPHYHYYYY